MCDKGRANTERYEKRITYQPADEAENSIKEEADRGNDLEERLGKKAPQRVKLLLCVRHAINLALGVVNCLGDARGQLLAGSWLASMVLRTILLLFH